MPLLLIPCKDIPNSSNNNNNNNKELPIVHRLLSLFPHPIPLLLLQWLFTHRHPSNKLMDRLLNFAFIVEQDLSSLLEFKEMGVFASTARRKWLHLLLLLLTILQLITVNLHLSNLFSLLFITLCKTLPSHMIV